MPRLAETVASETRAFLAIPSVVGYEKPFLDRLEELGHSLGRETVRSDGGLLWAGPRGQDVLSVHVDRHGLLGSTDGEFEYAAYARKRLAETEEFHVTRRMLERVAPRFIGESVFAYDGDTGEVLAEGEVERAYVCPFRDNLVFRIPSLGSFPVGQPVSYEPVCEMEASHVVGQLDNCASVSIAVALCRSGFGGSVAFTREEEVGRSWLHLKGILGSLQAVGRLIVLDTSPFESSVDVKEGTVVLRRRDSGATFDAELVSGIAKRASELGIPVLLKDEWLMTRARVEGKDPERVHLGRTELGRLVSESKGKWNGASVQLPTIGYHTNRERAAVSSIENLMRLLADFLSC